MSIIENTIHGNTMLLTLNNPTKRNSMIKGFHDEFQSSIKMAEENKDVFSIIITGAGDFFCAGGDLNALKTRRSMTEEQRYETLKSIKWNYRSYI
jgi:enoyl-CoA hydratase/carnithine racemase